MPRALVLALSLLVPAALHAQDVGTGRVRVRATHDGRALAGVDVRAGDARAVTDTAGTTRLTLPAGEHRLTLSRLGFLPDTIRLSLRADADTTLDVELRARPAEVEGIVVSVTRSERRQDDVPMRVEVLVREEIEEKLLMTPGDISMMLNETGGVRVQATNPSLGGATVRIQGLRGRYTLLLADGLPLHGAQAGGLGVLQIPPMDLGRVEIVKGGASALYGPAALGGVVNLVSRAPGEAAEHEILLNQTSRDGTDAVLWLSGPVGERWGATLLAGGHRQRRVDVDGDGWTDIPGYRRGVVRPRLHWRGEGGRSALLTLGATAESRRGGTVAGARAPDGLSYAEDQETARFDLGAIARLPFGSSVATLRGASATQAHDHRFGATRERDRHDVHFAEASLATARAIGTTVLGAAVQVERYDARDVEGFDHTYTIPAAFAQHDVDLGRALSLTASLRADVHEEYGTLVNPRLSARARLPREWTARASVATGSFAPTPFTEATEATGLAVLRPLGELRAERARTASIDVGGPAGPWELGAALFASRIAHALLVRDETGASPSLRIENATSPTRTGGADLFARWRRGDLTATASYTFVRATEQAEDGGRRSVPLTPRHAAGLVAVWEQEGMGRVGLETYFTGAQALDADPYRAEGAPYVIVGAIAERRIGRVRAFVNLENLGDVRLSRHQPLVRPSRGPGGRWTTDAWAPLDGRVINAGVRVALGAREEHEESAEH
jgi:iron complex outermembrane receptor protein